MPGSRRKVFEVMKATTKPEFNSVDVGKGKREFGRTGAMVITDPGEAKAIDQAHGHKATGEVVVMPVDDHWKEPGHTYQFTAVGMPWAKYDELGRRIHEEERQGAEGSEEKRPEGGLIEGNHGKG